MTYEPIKTEEQSGKWLATSKIGPIPARVLRETEKEAVETVKFLISHHCNVPKESIPDPEWKQTDDMFGANYQPTFQAKFEHKAFGYYVTKDGNGKIGFLDQLK